jgi:RNA polymerase sigma-70 factor (ECF subfamily)
MSVLPPETDEQLLSRLEAGDEAAFQVLYRRRQGAIYRFAWHVTGSEAVAEDITQEVFLTLIRNVCRFDPERGTLNGYLFGIARKLVLRHLERTRMDVALDGSGDESSAPHLAIHHDPGVAMADRERVEALRRAVDHLPRRYREVVVLCDLEEVDYADAAAILACPIGTVRSRLHRARALLFEKLSQERSARGEMKDLKPARCWT